MTARAQAVSRRLTASQRRDQILGAANRVFARHGYRGATTRAIAREAGVAEALIYRHFATKEALFVAAIERTAGRLIDGATAALMSSDQGPAVAIRALVAYLGGVAQRDPTLATMIFVVSAELTNPAVRAAYVPIQERALGMIATAVDAWHASGLLPRRLPSRAVAWLVLGIFHAVAVMQLTGHASELSDAETAGIVERVLGLPAAR